MLIRLYSGCRLSQNYDEIFYPKKISNVNVFEAYLATLQYVDIDLDYAYLTRQGVLSFEWDAWADGNVSKYNYMRVSDDELTSYAFITSVNYINGLATVNYAIDIWHTYAPSMTLGDSIMTATRFPRATAPRALPLSYTTNSGPTEIISNTSGKVGAIVQYQTVELAQQGTVSPRKVHTGLFTWNTWDVALTYTEEYLGTFEEVAEMCLQLVAQSSVYEAVDKETYPQWWDFTASNYEIKAIWILPEEWLLLVKQYIAANSIAALEILKDKNTPPPHYKLFPLDEATFAHAYTIPANDKIIGFGTHTNAVPISYNGIAHGATVRLVFSPSEFNIELGIDGGRNTITSEYEFDIPIAAASAAETQQAEIARRLRNQQSTAQLWQTSFSIAGSIASVATAGATGALGAAQVIATIGSVGSGLMNIAAITANKEANNAKIYASNAGTRCRSSCALNSVRGICELRMLAANQADVDAAIAAEGYIVYYGTSALYPDATAPADATLTTREYDILKYSFTRVYGGFPEDIKEALKNILLSGARIWYKIPA